MGLLIQHDAAARECCAVGYKRQKLPFFDLVPAPAGSVDSLAFRTLDPIRFPLIDGCEQVRGYMLFSCAVGGEPLWVTTLPAGVVYSATNEVFVAAGDLVYYARRP